MNKWLLVLIGISFFFAWGKFKHRLLSPNKLPENYSSNGRPLSCMGKKQCAIIYIAPWCGACNQMAPHFKTFLNKAKGNVDFSVKVIVGQGSKEDNEDKALSYDNEEVYLDPQSVVKDSLGISYFPTILVVDSQGAIQLRDQEAWNWMAQNIN